MQGCIFCLIVAGEVPADVVHRDERAVAFRDLAPQAPVHLLVVPTTHWESLDAVPADAEGDVGHLLAVCRDLADRLGLQGGYRVVANTGADGGQSVGHLHLHLLGGRSLDWPPG